MTESFPRQQARTRRFTLGVPHAFRVSPDGTRVVFLRSRGGTDPVTCLWQLDLATGQEELIADPLALDAADEDLPAEEKARRERAREQAGGVVSYATDTALSVAAFTLAGRVYVASLTGHGPGAGHETGTSHGTGTKVREIAIHKPAFDPRPDPTGSRLAYVCQGALRVAELDNSNGTSGPTGTVLLDPADQPGITFGLAEFIAAEEMDRMRGYWWSPDGRAVLAARVDERPVDRWHIADPANPGRPATDVGYPAAGTANADVSLVLAGLDGQRTEIGIDWDVFPYLVTVNWEKASPLIVVQTRDQQRMRLLAADPGTGAITVLREDTDPRWLDIVPGVPAWTADGRIVWTADADGARRLIVATPQDIAAAEPVTPATLQVRDVLGVDGNVVAFSASKDDPAEISVWSYGPAGVTQVSSGSGVHAAVRNAGTTVLASRDLDGPGARVQVLRGNEPPTPVASFADQPNLPRLTVTLLRAGQREIRTALLLPSWHQPGSARLPVLLDPYGGPHAQRVLATQAIFLTSQWFAEQGFAVIVADGRGTPGRGPDWDRAVYHDLAGPVLEDQVEALQATAAQCADLDTDRVAIRGWSFGGYLAALAVLRRPDIFHAAVAGAPVTDWRLYDTHYTERYLGHPAHNPTSYATCGLLDDAAKLSRPLLLIHGLADDNVVAAHTLRLSSALLAAGRPHSVLPLSGVTHMTPQEAVAENLLLLQVDFLRRALAM